MHGRLAIAMGRIFLRSVPGFMGVDETVSRRLVVKECEEKGYEKEWKTVTRKQ